MEGKASYNHEDQFPGCPLISAPSIGAPDEHCIENDMGTGSQLDSPDDSDSDESRRRTAAPRPWSRKLIPIDNGGEKIHRPEVLGREGSKQTPIQAANSTARMIATATSDGRSAAAG